MVIEGIKVLRGRPLGLVISGTESLVRSLYTILVSLFDYLIIIEFQILVSYNKASSSSPERCIQVKEGTSQLQHLQVFSPLHKYSTASNLDDAQAMTHTENIDE